MMKILGRLDKLTADLGSEDIGMDIKQELKTWHASNSVQFPVVAGRLDFLADAIVKHMAGSNQLFKFDFAKSSKEYHNQTFEREYIDSVKDFTRIIAGKREGDDFTIDHTIRETYGFVGRRLQTAFPGLIVMCKESSGRILAVTLVRFETKQDFFRQATFLTTRVKTAENSTFFQCCIDAEFTNVIAIEDMHSFVSKRIFDLSTPIVMTFTDEDGDRLSFGELESMLSIYMHCHGYTMHSIDNMPSECWEAMDRSHAAFVGGVEVPSLFFKAEKDGDVEGNMYFAIKKGAVVRVYVSI